MNTFQGKVSGLTQNISEIVLIVQNGRRGIQLQFITIKIKIDSLERAQEDCKEGGYAGMSSDVTILANEDLLSVFLMSPSIY